MRQQLSARGARAPVRSRPGQVALVSGVIAVVGIVTSIVGFATGALTTAESPADNWGMTMFASAVLVSALVAAASGALAVFRRADRRPAVIAATAAGALVTALLVNEVLQAF